MTAELTVEVQRQLQPTHPWEDITCLLWHNNMLFTSVTTNFSETTTGCNGKINVWDKCLNPLGEFRAHDYGLYHMCPGPEATFYTCASDSIICHWKCERVQESSNPDHTTGLIEVTKLSTLRGHLEPPWRMQFCIGNGKLYSADELGEIRMWENDKYKGVMETYEEVWDMIVLPKYIFTVRHLDVTVTSIPDDGVKKACSIKNTIPGKGPLFVSKDRLFLVNRHNNDIMVHSIPDIGNPHLKTLQGHESLINSFVGDETIMFSGDYDGKIIAWDLENMSKITEISLSENKCINNLTYDKTEECLYAAQEKKVLSKILYQKVKAK